MWSEKLYRFRKCGLAPLAVLAAAVPASAAAMPSMPAIGLYPTVLPLATSVEISIGCEDTKAALIAAPAPAPAPAPSIVSYSKSSAILGGEMSALERMKAQQAGQAVHPPIASAAEVPKLEPAATGIRKAQKPCGIDFSAVDRIKSAVPVVETKTDDFLASKRVEIAKTSFDKDWRRVRSENLSATSRPLRNLSAATDMKTVETVNQWVNRNIKYVEDRQLFGRADYWAGARLTMILKKGDCEDIALTKMQLLAAAGFSRDDMYITIARDTIRRADHALLVVKLDDGFVVLDNATDKVLDGASAHGYAPVLSFAGEKSWLHGY